MNKKAEAQEKPQQGKFRRLPKGAPEFWIMQDGDDMLVGIAFIGSLEYNRKDRKHVARMLRRAAAFVQENS